MDLRQCGEMRHLHFSWEVTHDQYLMNLLFIFFNRHNVQMITILRESFFPFGLADFEGQKTVLREVRFSFRKNSLWGYRAIA